jgi:selenocysteine lyase/cysteine desulfurase
MLSGGDIHWDTWLAQRETARTRVAEFINAEPDEIALTTNTSSGMNVIIDALEGRGECFPAIWNSRFLRCRG